jgi:hypothetical protein
VRYTHQEQVTEPGAPVEVVSNTVTPTQVVSAGLASTAAAFVTSRFGVAGTLLGAALTAMIITGGSAILRSYLENVPNKLRARRQRRKAGRSAKPDTLPERPDLRDNFMGRMRAAMGWFSQLPLFTRRSILVKGLIGGAVAFMIGIGAVYAAETIIGNSLSCGLWSNCPKGATPGTHLGGGDGVGASPTITLGRAKTNTTPTTLQSAPQNRGQNTLKPRNSNVQQHPAASPEKQQGLSQLAPDSGSDQNPSTQKAQEPVQPQTPQPQKRPVIPGKEPAVKPGSAEQAPPSEQNPSPPGGASAPSRQEGTPSGGTNSPPPNSSSEKVPASSSSPLPRDATN